MKAMVICTFVAGVGCQAMADCSPTKIVRIVTENQSPNIPPGHFAGRPSTFYRLGTKYLRNEEAADTANGIHGLVIVSEPDSWMINLADHTGKHIVDKEPGGKVRAPVFQKSLWPQDFPPEYLELEFGCEQSFFDGFHSPLTTLKAPAGTLTKQAFGVNDWMLVLIRKSPKSPPDTIFMFHKDEIVFVLKYLTYEVLPEPGMKLFERPEGIKLEEAGPA